MDKVIMEAEGYSGQLQLLEDRIRITRKGFKALVIHGFKGDKEILLSQVSAVTLMKAEGQGYGYLQFSFLGGQESKGDLSAAMSDENAVVFNGKQERAFVAIKQAIDERLDSLHAVRKTASSLDEVEKLASLRDKGIITEDEFQQKKRQLLGL